MVILQLIDHYILLKGSISEAQKLILHEQKKKSNVVPMQIYPKEFY